MIQINWRSYHFGDKNNDVQWQQKGDSNDSDNNSNKEEEEEEHPTLARGVVMVELAEVLVQEAQKEEQKITIITTNTISSGSKNGLASAHRRII
jgi:hypothetical protein